MIARLWIVLVLDVLCNSYLTTHQQHTVGDANAVDGDANITPVLKSSTQQSVTKAVLCHYCITNNSKL